jgi:hypothetical protein
LLVASLTRVGGGRPEAQLGTVTIAPRRPSRHDDRGRFSVHVTTGPAEERIEQHVELAHAPTNGPALDLLAHALNVARAERELSLDGVDAVVMSADFAAQLARLATTAIAKHPAEFDQSDEFLDQLRHLRQQVLEAAAGGGPH